jgi:hypothetical protein
MAIRIELCHAEVGRRRRQIILEDKPSLIEPQRKLLLHELGFSFAAEALFEPVKKTEKSFHGGKR